MCEHNHASLIAGTWSIEHTDAIVGVAVYWCSDCGAVRRTNNGREFAVHLQGGNTRLQNGWTLPRLKDPT